MTIEHRTGRYSYDRDQDDCDDTFEIWGPDGEHLVSIPFWGSDPEWAARAESTARRIVHRLNMHDELLKALEDLLADLSGLASEFEICREVLHSSCGKAARAAVKKERKV